MTQRQLPPNALLLDTYGLRSIPLSAWRPDWLAGGSASLNTVLAYQTVSWVYRCVNLRAQAIRAMPYVITGADGQEVEWPLASIMGDLLYLTEAALCLYGAAYWYKEANPFALTRLRWLHPSTMQLVTDRDAGLTGFKRTLGGQQKPVALEDVVYFFLPSLEAEVGPGTPPAQVALDAAGLARYTNEYTAAFFQRGAIPATILTVEGIAPDDQLTKLEKWWRHMLQGVRRAFETVAVRANVKPQVIGQPLKDLVIRPLLIEARSQIAVAFGIPQTLLEDAANFATAKEHKLSFYHETVIPEARAIEGGANSQLFEPAGLRLAFLPERLEALQQDEATKATAMVQLVAGGIIDRREAREALGYDPNTAPSLPPAPTGPSPIALPPSFFDTATIAPADALAPLAIASAPLSKEGYKDLARWRRIAASRFAYPFRSEHVPPWLMRAIATRLSDPLYRDSAFDPCLRQWDREAAERALAKKIRAALKNYADNALATALSSGKVDTADLAHTLLSAINTHLATLTTDRVLAMATETGYGVDFDRVLLDAARWARQYTYELVKDIDAKTQLLLQDTISQVANKDLTLEDASALLQPTFSETRANAIAVTETTRANSQATELYKGQLEERGVAIVVRWLTAEDERVCEECGPLDHTLEDVWRAIAPSGPPLHPYCRCETVIERAP